MDSRKSLLQNALLAISLGTLACGAQADSIPYLNAGTYNSAGYSFSAAADGHVYAYIVGGFGAGYENQMGLMVNGVLTSAGFGLDNHHSAVGDSFDLGYVHAGDTLTFVLHNLTVGMDAYSDSSLNTSYDFSGNDHNHIYSTAYTATSPNYPAVPVGTYVGFEDLQFPNSDFNYNDESFVFTNVASNVAVPEPGTLVLVGAALSGLGLLTRRRKY